MTNSNTDLRPIDDLDDLINETLDELYHPDNRTLNNIAPISLDYLRDDIYAAPFDYLPDSPRFLAINNISADDFDSLALDDPDNRYDTLQIDRAMMLEIIICELRSALAMLPDAIDKIAAL